MKKIILCSVFVFLGLILLTGCGKGDLKEYAGIYKLEYSKYVGDPDTAKDTSEIAEMVLNEDGTGKSNRNGTSYDIEWSIDGENITITEKFMGIKLDYNGTLINGRLDLFNGDKTLDLTNETVYNRQ